MALRVGVQVNPAGFKGRSIGHLFKGKITGQLMALRVGLQVNSAGFKSRITGHLFKGKITGQPCWL